MYLPAHHDLWGLGTAGTEDKREEKLKTQYKILLSDLKCKLATCFASLSVYMDCDISSALLRDSECDWGGPGSI